MTDRAAGLTALVLGSAAGGGFPQWNCGCRSVCACESRRPTGSSGDTGQRRGHRQRNRVDRGRRFAGSAPADLADAAPWPRAGPATSPIAGRRADRRRRRCDWPACWCCVNGRHSPYMRRAPLLDLLRRNRIFDVLDPVAGAAGGDRAAGAGAVRRRSHASRCWPMPGKVPLYLEDADARAAGARTDLCGPA